MHIENVTVLPRKNASDAPVWGLGGLINSDGKFIEESSYKNGWSQFGGLYSFDRDNVVHQNEHVIWGGIFVKHWGHFLIDFMTRVWYPALHEHNKKFIYVANKDDKIDGNYAEILSLMGIKGERLIKISEPTSFNSITVPEIAYKKSAYFYNDFNLSFVKAINKAASLFSSHPSRKIYFSRLKLNEAKMKEVGESFLEDAFQKNGFDIVYPESLNVVEQIILWNTSSEIACLNGTIPLNIPLCGKKDLRITVLNKTSRLHENLLWFESVFDCPIVYVDVYDPLLTNKKKSLGKGPFIMYVTKELSKYFEENHQKISPTPLPQVLINRINFIKLRFVLFFQNLKIKFGRKLIKIYKAEFK